VWANKLTSAANAIVLQYTAPLFVFIFVRFFFGEAIPRRNRLALAAGMAGIGVIFVGSRGTPDVAGVGVALLSGFFFGVFVTNLRLLKAADPITLTFANNLACALILLPLVRGELGVRPGELVALVLMGVVQLGIPYWLFTRGVQTVAVQEASLMVLIEPVLNPVWVAWGVGEWPAATTLVGGGIILSSLALRYWWLGESPPAPEAQAKGRPSEGRAESPRSD
jgi:drug/metabolite transporter (DMT)-like permease